MDKHLGYDKYKHSDENNYRNGTKSETIISKYDKFKVNIPQDRKSSLYTETVLIEETSFSSLGKSMVTNRETDCFNCVHS